MVTEGPVDVLPIIPAEEEFQLHESHLVPTNLPLIPAQKMNASTIWLAKPCVIGTNEHLVGRQRSLDSPLKQKLNHESQLYITCTEPDPHPTPKKLSVQQIKLVNGTFLVLDPFKDSRIG